MAHYRLDCNRSSDMAWARYESNSETLEIDFKGKDGKYKETYSYAQFPVEEWRAFCSAPQKGKHFAFEIRPHYPGVRKPKPGEKPKPVQGSFDL